MVQIHLLPPCIPSSSGRAAGFHPVGGEFESRGMLQMRGVNEGTYSPHFNESTNSRHAL
jgi:hypothetical protein